MIAIILLLLTNVLANFEDLQDCRNSTIGKKPGNVYFNLNHRVINAKPDQVFSKENLKECSETCIKDLKCQLVEYGHETNNCSMYFNIPKVVNDNSDRFDLFYWRFCNLSDSINTKELAYGFWFYDIDIKLDVDEHVFHFNGGFQNCREQCRINPLCGGFNFNNENRLCELLVIWNTLKINLQEEKGWRGYYWVLKSPITYNVENEYCRRIESKQCLGKWKAKMLTGVTSTEIMVTFHTRNFTKCYKSCELYKNCKKVLFHYLTSKCRLVPEQNLKCVKSQATSMGKRVEVEWVCCNRKDYFSSVNTNYQLNNARNCFKIRYPENVALVPFNCNIPYDNLNENCYSKGKKHSINCYRDQSFISTWKHFGQYLIIFNGYQTFLLKNATVKNFVSENYASCLLYNAALPQKPKISLTSAKDWFSIYTNETNRDIILPAKMIIVGELHHHNCLCLEWLHCVEILRAYQNNVHKNKKMNIPYHFIISPSGEIFEGRGWLQQTKMFSLNNDRSTYYIGFLGNYCKNNPTISSLVAFKNWIKLGILKKYITKNYYLVTERDFRPSRYRNSKNLYNVIRTQARYKGLKKEDCLQISIKTMSLNGLFFGFIMIIVFALSSILYRWGHTKDCRILKGNIDQEDLLNLTIYPLSEYCKVRLYYYEDTKSFIKNADYAVNISNTIIFWVTEVSEIFDCSYCMEKMKQCLLIFKKRNKIIKMSQINLINQFCEKELVCLVFQSQCTLSNVILVMVHLRCFNIESKIKNIIAAILNAKCVCSGFKIDLLDMKTKDSAFQAIII